jgi:hypothetical protein
MLATVTLNEGRMPNEMLTLYWWFSVVIVGILVNLASGYLKAPIDKILSSWSSRWKERVEREEIHSEMFIDLHLRDPTLIMLSGFEGVWCAIFGSLCALGSLGAITLGQFFDKGGWTFAFIAICLMIIHTLNTFRSLKLARLLGILKERKMRNLRPLETVKIEK